MFSRKMTWVVTIFFYFLQYGVGKFIYPALLRTAEIVLSYSSPRPRQLSCKAAGNYSLLVLDYAETFSGQMQENQNSRDKCRKIKILWTNVGKMAPHTVIKMFLREIKQKQSSLYKIVNYFGYLALFCKLTIILKTYNVSMNFIRCL